MPHCRRLPVFLCLVLTPWLSHAQSTAQTPQATGSLAEAEEFEMPEIVIEGKAESLIGIATSASKGQTSAKELLARPFSRRGELLESIPGFIATQHSGDGKANQYYLRGTNLDHGNDFAIYVDGMLVNLRNHAHGQGYADTNFLIPELVGQLDYWKGTYFAQHGDLSSTGAARFKLVDSLPQGILSTTLGQFMYERTLIADTIKAGSGLLTVAFEHQYYNGPWQLPASAVRLNGFARYHWADATDNVNVTLMGYRGKWDSTDQVPSRVVGNLIDRYGSLDPTDGGNSQRYSLSLDWVHEGDHSTTRTNLYGGFYDLDLFSDFTFFMDNPVQGDQFEQKDHRWFVGGQVAKDWRWDALGQEQRLTLGVQMRTDFISGLGLYNTTQRQRWNTISVNDIIQDTWGVFAEAELKPTRWLRIIPGLRGDVMQFDVTRSNIAGNTGSKVSGIISPKLNVVFGPWKKTEFYLNAGTGFHSNDTRGVVGGIDPATGLATSRATPLVRTYGAEFGIRNESIPKLVNTLSFWTLHSGSELIYQGDTGSSSPGPSSQRFGIELSSYWRPNDWTMLDVEATCTRAYLLAQDPSHQNVPNSIPYTLNAGITLGKAQGLFGSLRVRYMAPRPLDQVLDVYSRESIQVNGRIGYRHKNLEVALDCLNLLNRSDYDVAYYYASQLKTDAAPVNDVHVHPIEPRMFRLSVTYRF
ncbi:TonB-dependent receptor [Prosthecobacter sp.]|uniref:TonB-dependent receptor n=1 Tax=Prosthecobacter sp. TaxID=1965333 RepID=UPI003784DF22